MAERPVSSPAIPRWLVLRRYAARAVLCLSALAVLTYLADYGVLRYRIAANRAPFGSVTVQPLYAVPQKNHRTEYLLEEPRDQTCVNSLLPHMGDPPCWYLSRHKEQQINL
ncbi:MAG: hypothetical protein JO270_24020 [Acidobacteriaceae bacterium]|nr:hypothetical protein [Acidobacteriaceae bacterium]